MESRDFFTTECLLSALVTEIAQNLEMCENCNFKTGGSMPCLSRSLGLKQYQSHSLGLSPKRITKTWRLVTDRSFLCQITLQNTYTTPLPLWSLKNEDYKKLPYR